MPQDLDHAVFDRLAWGGVVDVPSLAGALGVDEPMVVDALDRLEAMGLALTRTPGGVRLQTAITPLSVKAITQALSAQAAERLWRLHVAFSVDSTNSRLMEWAGESTQPLGLLAEHQSAGRGRGGRQWSSPLGANVYLSVYWPFQPGLAPTGALSLAVAQALAQRLSVLGVPARVKWPNDIYIDGRKVGGVLLESRMRRDGGWSLVVGVGLNYALPDAVKTTLSRPVTDVVAHLPEGSATNRNGLAAAVLNAVDAACSAYASAGRVAAVRDWPEWDAFPGADVHCDIGGGRRARGQARGVDAQGRLLVETADGVLALSAGDVTYENAT